MGEEMTSWCGCLTCFLQILPTIKGHGAKVTPLRSGGQRSESKSFATLDASALTKLMNGNAESFKMPLNEREVIALMRNWKFVQKEIVATGKSMFLRMFETNAKVKSAFEKFRSMDTPAELWQSAVLDTHGLVVMSAIDEIISNLDDKETVCEMIVEQGRSHIRFGDLSEELFWCVEDAFLHAIKETLHKNYPSHLRAMYTKVIRFIINLLVLGFKSAADEEQAIRAQPPGVPDCHGVA